MDVVRGILMTIKNFYFSQLANMRIEGVGIHASFSISMVVKDENTTDGKKIYISAAGKTAAVKAAGSGVALFWCKIRNNIDNHEAILQRKFNERFAVGIDEILIGSTEFFIKKNDKSASIIVEGGYVISGYTGQIVPFPKSLKRVINLTPF